MEKIEIYVSNVIKDKFYDCIETKIEGVAIQIVFAKADNVERYNGHSVFLSKEEGFDYALSEIAEEQEDL